MAKQSGFSEQLLARYDRLIQTLEHEGVERKGATMPYTSHNGHMFSFLTPEGRLAMRLPKGEVDGFIERFGGGRCRQHGRVLEEYVEIDDALVEKTSTLSRHFRASWAYVDSLAPKPTTRAKAGAKKKTRVATKVAAKKSPPGKKSTRAAPKANKVGAKKKSAATRSR